MKLRWIALFHGQSAILAELLTIKELLMTAQTDIDALTTRLDSVSTAIETGIAGIRQDIADLKAANPALDTSALEASVAKLEADSSDVTELDAENPAV